MPPSSVAQYPCPSCRANMAFDPAKGVLACSYCGNTQAPLKTNARQRAAVLFEHRLPGLAEEEGEDSQAMFETVLSRTAQQVDCPGCRVTLTFEPQDVADQCPFCQTSIVIQPRAASPMIAPSGVVPFAVGRRDAMQAMQAWLSRRWDFDDWEAMTAKGQIQSLTKIKQQPIGLYLPFWTYDAQTITNYRGVRGDTGRSKGKLQTKWSSVSGRVGQVFDDVMVVASKASSRDLLEKLWSSVLMDDVAPYDPRYLAGFRAQRYQIPVLEGFERAKEYMEKKIRDLIRKEIGGDSQRIDYLITDHSKTSFKHVLLPVWLSSYRYEDDIFQVMVNARTGKVLGERPKSRWREFFLTLLILIVFLLMLLVPSLFFMFLGTGEIFFGLFIFVAVLTSLALFSLVILVLTDI